MWRIKTLRKRGIKLLTYIMDRKRMKWVATHSILPNVVLLQYSQGNDRVGNLSRTEPNLFSCRTKPNQGRLSGFDYDPNVQAYRGLIINAMDLILPEISSFGQPFEDFTKIAQKFILFCSFLFISSEVPYCHLTYRPNQFSEWDSKIS